MNEKQADKLIDILQSIRFSLFEIEQNSHRWAHTYNCEHTENEIRFRVANVLANEAKIPVNRIIDATLTSDEWIALTDVIAKCVESKLLGDGEVRSFLSKMTK